MPSHISGHIPRRSALALAGLGSVGVIASCISGMREPQAKTADETRTNFAGETRIDSYDTSAGAFKPATREHPAKNVPKPVRPEQMNEKSVRGLYDTIAYINAALQYMNSTGDTGLYDAAAASEPGKTVIRGEQDNQALALMRDGKVWFDNPVSTLVLASAEPKIEGDTYTWKGKNTLDYGSFQVGERETRELSVTQRYEITETVFTAVYRNGRWWCRVTVPGKTPGDAARNDLFAHFRMRVEDLAPKPAPEPDEKPA